MKKSEKTVRKSRAKPWSDPKDFDMNIPSDDIIWIAGILEGEGSFGIDKWATNKYKESTAPAAPYIKLSMTDRDVAKKFGDIVQKKPYQASKLTKGGKIEYIVSVGKRETLYYLLPWIVSYMGVRRKARIQELIDLLEKWWEWLLSGGRSISAKKGGEAKAKTKRND